MQSALNSLAGIMLVCAFWMFWFWAFDIRLLWQTAAALAVIAVIVYAAAALAGRIALKRRAKSWQTPSS